MESLCERMLSGQRELLLQTRERRITVLRLCAFFVSEFTPLGTGGVDMDCGLRVYTVGRECTLYCRLMLVLERMGDVCLLRISRVLRSV